MDLREFEAAHRQFQELVADPTLTDRERDPLVNNLAWSSVFVDDPNALREGHLLAEAFVRMNERVGYGHGTYGAVLAREGQHDAAIRELEIAWKLNTEPESHAHNAAWLAYCHARKRDAKTARAYLDTARQLDPRCYSIPIAEGAVNPPSSAADDSSQAPELS